MDQQNVGSKRSASGTSGKIAAKSHEAAEQLKEAVVDQANQVRDKVRSATEHTGDRIRGVATQLRSVSDNLREEDPLAAQLAERASRGIEGVAQYVSTTSAQSLIRDTEQLARRQPALFFGSAFLLGLAAGRFIKASSPQNAYGRSNDDGYDGGRFARRQGRESGFFPQGEPDGTNNRYRENVNATFGRDLEQRDTLGRQANEPEPYRASTEPYRASTEPYQASTEQRTSTEPFRSETEPFRPASERNGVDTTGKPTARGSRP